MSPAVAKFLARSSPKYPPSPHKECDMSFPLTRLPLTPAVCFLSLSLLTVPPARAFAQSTECVGCKAGSACPSGNCPSGTPSQVGTTYSGFGSASCESCDTGPSCASCGPCEACGGGCGGATHCGLPAPSYPVPFATPRPTTVTRFTYPPLMPHHALPHYNNVYSFQHGPGLSRTTVRWTPAKVRNAVDFVTHLFELPR